MEENVKILTIPLGQNSGSYSDIWIGIPNIQRSVHIGLQRPDGSIWKGLSQDNNKDRGWPNFINAWYVANIYSKALEKCVGKTAIDPLLSRCSSVFKINKSLSQLDNSMFVLTFLPHKQQDVNDLLLQLPPLEYIETVLVIARREGLLFDSQLLREFLNLYTEKIPHLFYTYLDVYDSWRMELVK